MNIARSYTTGEALLLERRQKAVIAELRIEPILRQLAVDIENAVLIEHERGLLFAEFPELEFFPVDGGLAL